MTLGRRGKSTGPVRSIAAGAAAGAEPEQVLPLFAGLKSPGHGPPLTCYAAGPIGEACRLRIEVTDSQRKVIRVRCGKGAKDRQTILSPRCLRSCEHWKLDRPSGCLFPTGSVRPVSPETVRTVPPRGMPPGSAVVHASHVASQLRHGPARTRDRAGRHPGPAGAQLDPDDDGLHARQHGTDRERDESA